MLSGVRPRERPRVLFFALLLALLAAALAVGITAAESLLLGTLGVRALPATILLASLAAMAGSLGYAAVLGRIRHDRLLALVFALLAGLVLASWLAMPHLAPRLLLPALVGLSTLAGAVLNNHFWVLAGDSFDPLAQKRIFPRLALGSSLGGFLGGTAASLASRSLEARSLLLIWALLLGLGALLVALFSRRLAAWSAGPSRPADQAFASTVRFLGRSALARGMLAMLAGMVLCLGLAQYCYSDLFARSFPDPTRLASFLGALVAIAYLVEIPFLAGLTPWLLQRAGVPLTSLLHPLLAVGAFLALGLDYSLLAAVFAWSVHRMFQNCLGSPARGLVYNAFPARYRARLRAFLEGVVSYAARALAGGLLLLAQTALLPSQLVWAGLALALFYLAGAARVRSAYLGALLEDITRGGLAADIPLPPERLARMGRAALEAGDLSPLGRRVVDLPDELLLQALHHVNPEVRATAAAALGPAVPSEVLKDPEPSVRLAALKLASEPARLALLADPDPRVRASAAATLPEQGLPVLESLLREHPESALKQLPEWACELARPFLSHPVPLLSALALDRLGSELTLSDLERRLDHPDSAVRLAAARALGERSDPLALEILAGALADEAREVRLQAARGLSAAGASGARAAEPALRSSRLATVEAAVQAAGEESLRAELRGLLTEAREDLRWLRAAESSADDLAARLLPAALKDRLQRARRLSLTILERLEGAEAVGGVRRRLKVARSRERAEALEALSNLGDRDSAAVLVELLEEQPGEATRSAQPSGEFLEQARRSPDPRLRMAAGALLGEGWPPGQAERQERLLRLQALPLLAGLTLDELEGLLEQATRERFLEGQALYRAGDRADRFYVLLEGSVEELGERIEPVSLLGELGVLDGGPRRATALAQSRVELLSWRPESLFGWLRERPELSLEMFRLLTRKLRQAESRQA